jgi:hypothetical protein
MNVLKRESALENMQRRRKCYWNYHQKILAASKIG